MLLRVVAVGILLFLAGCGLSETAADKNPHAQKLLTALKSATEVKVVDFNEKAIEPRTLAISGKKLNRLVGRAHFRSVKDLTGAKLGNDEVIELDVLKDGKVVANFFYFDVETIIFIDGDRTIHMEMSSGFADAIREVFDVKPSPAA